MGRAAALGVVLFVVDGVWRAHIELPVVTVLALVAWGCWASLIAAGVVRAERRVNKSHTADGREQS